MPKQPLHNRKALYIDQKGGVTDVSSPPPIRVLVYRGGGAKCYVYMGALKELERQNILQGVLAQRGSSAGAISAFLVALGCNAKQCKDFFFALDEKKIMTKNSEPDPEYQKSGPFHKLYKSDGKSLLDSFRKIATFQCEKFIAAYKHTHRFSKIRPALNKDFPIKVTFRDLRILNQNFPQFGFKDLLITSTKIKSQETEYLSADTNPDFEIATALLESISLPGIFKSPFRNGEYHCDGGLLNNLPNKVPAGTHNYKGYKQEDANLDVLNIHIIEYDEVDPVFGIVHSQYANNHSQKDLAEHPSFLQRLSFFKADILLRLRIFAIDTFTGLHVGLKNKELQQRVHDEYPQRSIVIRLPKGVSATRFAMTENERLQLVAEGERFTKQWIQNYYGAYVHHRYANFSVLTSLLNPSELEALRDDLRTPGKIEIRGPNGLDSDQLRKKLLDKVTTPTCTLNARPPILGLSK